MIQIIITGKDKEKIMGFFDNDKEYRAIGRRLDKIDVNIAALTALIIKQGKDNMAKADEVRVIVNKLRDDVAAQTTVVASVHTLLTNLATLIADLKTQIADADNIPQDIIDTVTNADAAINQAKDQLAADVAANTPAAPSA